MHLIFRTHIIFLLTIYHFGLQAQVGGDKQKVSQEFFLGELSEARSSNDYEKLSQVYFDFGIYEDTKNRNPEKSFEYFSRALEYFKITNDSTGIYNTRYHIASHLLRNNMYTDAQKEFTDLKKYFNRNGEDQLSAQIELKLFELHIEKLNLTSAENTLDQTRQILDKIDLPDLEVDYLISRIKYYEVVNELDTALILANDCYKMTEFDENPMARTACLTQRGEIHFKMGNYYGAISDYNVILPSLRSIPYNPQLLNVYKNMSKCYTQNSRFKIANFFLEEYAALQDSILNENRIIALNNLTYKHKSEEKSTEILLLEKNKVYAQKSFEQQKRALTILGITLGLMLLGIYYIIRFYKDKISTAKIIETQNEEINKQKIKELQDKIQINSMQSMLTGQELERERIAKDLHDSLGGLLSTIKLQVDNISAKEANVNMIPEYNKATNLLDTAVAEVRTISQNLQPGALSSLGLIPAINDLINRYDSESGPEIVFQHFDIPAKLDQTVALGIYRIVQEILNNALKHSEANEVLVQLIKENEYIVIHIEDDGKGFDAEKKYKSMGLENIKSRVNYLKGSIEIDSRANEGTSILIHVKYNLQ